MIDDWVSRLQQLNDHVLDSYSDDRLGDRAARRRLLSQWVGPIRQLTRLTGLPLEQVLQGRPLVGVDGSINTFGGQFPYYVDLLRALAKPSQGRPVVLKDMHCPLPPDTEVDDEIAIRNDHEIRQQKLATLEVQVALAAIDEVHPLLILMDGPLVRFAMRTKDSFAILREKVLKENIILVGCIENIESKVINSVMGDALPPGWVHRYDRDLLWDTLDYGEALAVGRPAKGLSRDQTEDDQAALIRTWFMRSSLEQGVVGVDMLEEQAGSFLGWRTTSSRSLPPTGAASPSG